MASRREKGKIPHSEWPSILARYGKGETMAKIGRDYECTAPAIRYIVKRSGMLKDRSAGEPAGAGDGAPRHQPHAEMPVAAESRGPAAWPEAAAPAPASPGRGHLLGPELRQRVSGDVASFLVALDHAVLEGSLKSVANLQEATDRLMRSTARTRLELERLLSGHETGGIREKDHGKAGSQPRRA